MKMNLKKSFTGKTAALGLAFAAALGAAGSAYAANPGQAPGNHAAAPSHAGGQSPRHQGRGMRDMFLKDAAQALGMSPLELRRELAKGRTLGEVAGARGVTHAQFNSAFHKAAVENLAKAKGSRSEKARSKKLKALEKMAARAWNHRSHPGRANGHGGRKGHGQGNGQGHGKPANTP